MDSLILEKIGLTAGEAKVYLALLRLGSTTTGPLAKESGVSSSKVYKVLDRLQNKGLAGSVIRGKTKYFSGVDPHRAMEFLDRKEKEVRRQREAFQKIIPELEMQQQLAKSQSQAVVYEGFKAVTNCLLTQLEHMKRGDEYAVLSGTYGETKGIYSFFVQYHQKRRKRGVIVNMLASDADREKIITTLGSKANIRFLPSHLVNNMLVYIYKEAIFLVLFIKTPIGFFIKGEEARKGFHSYFDAFWSIAVEK